MEVKRLKSIILNFEDGTNFTLSPEELTDYFSLVFKTTIKNMAFRSKS